MTETAVSRELNKRFGDNVRVLRQLSGKSMRALSDETGVGISIISRVEHGQGTTLCNAARIADGLGRPLTEMLSPGLLDQSARRLSSAVAVDMTLLKEVLDQEMEGV